MLYGLIKDMPDTLERIRFLKVLNAASGAFFFWKRIKNAAYVYAAEECLSSALALSLKRTFLSFYLNPFYFKWIIHIWPELIKIAFCQHAG